jgi:hypothetical protein
MDDKTTFDTFFVKNQRVWTDEEFEMEFVQQVQQQYKAITPCLVRVLPSVLCCLVTEYGITSVDCMFQTLPKRFSLDFKAPVDFVKLSKVAHFLSKPTTVSSLGRNIWRNSNAISPGKFTVSRLNSNEAACVFD